MFLVKESIRMIHAKYYKNIREFVKVTCRLFLDTVCIWHEGYSLVECQN